MKAVTSVITAMLVAQTVVAQEIGSKWIKDNLKKLISGLFLLAVACGGSGKDLSNWLGSWAGNQTTTVTCPGNAPVTQNSLVSVTLSNGSGADLQYTSNDGCLLKFNVSGSTATLANGPVTCSATSNGTAVSLSVASYTLYTSDGHHLTATAAGTATVSGVSCVFGLTGSGTR
jgi:hypothetical protein